MAASILHPVNLTALEAELPRGQPGGGAVTLLLALFVVVLTVTYT